MHLCVSMTLQRQLSARKAPILLCFVVIFLKITLILMNDVMYVVVVKYNTISFSLTCLPAFSTINFCSLFISSLPILLIGFGHTLKCIVKHECFVRLSFVGYTNKILEALCLKGCERRRVYLSKTA